jgi:hypothetical protein
MGEFRDLRDVTDKAKGMAVGSAREVPVIVNGWPYGVFVESGTIHAELSEYELVGAVYAKYNNPRWIVSGFWFYDYGGRDEWRKGFCWPQVPLSWLSLSLWAWVVPTYYPCRVAYGDDDDRRADIVETLQRAAKAVGGDVVAGVTFGDVDILMVNRYTGVVATVGTIETLSGTGYAFRRKASKRATENGTPSASADEQRAVDAHP